MGEELWKMAPERRTEPKGERYFGKIATGSAGGTCCGYSRHFGKIATGSACYSGQGY